MDKILLSLLIFPILTSCGIKPAPLTTVTETIRYHYCNDYRQNCAVETDNYILYTTCDFMPRLKIGKKYKIFKNEMNDIKEAYQIEDIL